MKVLSLRLYAACAISLLLNVPALHAQTPLTNDAVVKMTQAGLAEDVILSMINTQSGKYSATPDDLIALNKSGVSDKVIGAMVNKGSGNPSATKTVDPAANSVDAGTALDVGVYFKKNNEWVEVLPEVVNW